MTGTPGADDEISEETLLLVIHIRERAAQAPGAADLADLLTSAAAKGDDMSADEIRALARDAIAQAEQVSFLLGKLAGLLDEVGGT